MAWRKGRVIRGRSRVHLVEVHEPDEHAIRAASLGMATHTLSPMARGTDGHFHGLDGHGVNRMAHDTPPLQGFQGAAAENLPRQPTSRMHGVQGGPSDAPGFPSTGINTPSDLSGLFGIDVDMGIS